MEKLRRKGFKEGGGYATGQKDENARRDVKHVYSVCADYHPILSILAVSLIDREIKVYGMKQNGQKV